MNVNVIDNFNTVNIVHMLIFIQIQQQESRITKLFVTYAPLSVKPQLSFLKKLPLSK